MDENEWLKATDPLVLLEFLQASGKVGDRKLRLFAVACCQRVSDWMADEQTRKAVAVAERFAEGVADEGELNAARVAISTTASGSQYDAACLAAENTAELPVKASEAAICAAMAPAYAALPDNPRNPADAESIYKSTFLGEQVVQAALLRDIVANPFATPRPIQAAWLRWNDSTLLRIATGIYKERAFERLPVLADALLDAGCDDEPLLSHLRDGGPHALGCWALDLMLVKE